MRRPTEFDRTLVDETLRLSSLIDQGSRWSEDQDTQRQRRGLNLRRTTEHHHRGVSRANYLKETTKGRVPARKARSAELDYQTDASTPEKREREKGVYTLAFSTDSGWFAKISSLRSNTTCSRERDRN